MELTLTPSLWLQASATTRLKLAKDFGLHRSSGPQIITENGHVHVESDGYTVSDLRGMSIESMQKYVGTTSVDDLFSLFNLCIAKVEKKPEEHKSSK